MDSSIFSRHETHKMALINRRQVKYDLMDDNKNEYPQHKYLGKGYIYSIDGRLQGNELKGHFWIRLKQQD